MACMPKKQVSLTDDSKYGVSYKIQPTNELIVCRSNVPVERLPTPFVTLPIYPFSPLQQGCYDAGQG
jgi:hypothetical protein